MDIQIKKRDGTVEPFSIDKLIASITKSGVPLKKSEEISQKIKSWVESEAEGGVFESTKIRDRIINDLSKDFPAESESYKAYKK